MVMLTDFDFSSHPEVQPMRLTRSEYLRWAELGVFADKKVELLDGVVVANSPQGYKHAFAVSKINEWLVRQLSDHADILPQVPFAPPGENLPEPDLAVVEKTFAPGEPPHQAFLVVEIAESSLRYDRSTKLALYASADVPEYWVVDLVHQVVEVYREPLEDRYGALQTYRRGEQITLLAFPDSVFAVDVAFGLRQ